MCTGDPNPLKHGIANLIITFRQCWCDLETYLQNYKTSLSMLSYAAAVLLVTIHVSSLCGSMGHQPPASSDVASRPTDADRQRLYAQAMQQHTVQYEGSGNNPFPAQPPPQVFHAVESMTRERVVGYIGIVLSQVCNENDKLSGRVFDKSNNVVQMSLRKRGGVRMERRLSSSESGSIETRADSVSGSETALDAVENLIEKLLSSKFELRNLTLIIALVYLDRVASELHVYCNSETVLRLFGACLMVASKMHRNETSREQLAEALGIPISSLLETESGITEAVRDLSVQPQTLAAYVKPLVERGANQIGAPPSGATPQLLRQPPPPPPPV